MPASLVDSVHKKTIDTAFRETVDKFPQNSFLVVPSSNGRGYYDNGFALSYIEALRKVDDLKTRFTDAGYSAGHRIAIALDNRPEHILYKLALNSLGISCVPINPDYRASELSYILEHSGASALCMDAEFADVGRAAAQKAGCVEDLWGLEN